MKFPGVHDACLNLNYHTAIIQLAESFIVFYVNPATVHVVVSPYHVICNCLAVVQLRQKIFGSYILNESNFRKLTLRDILMFLTHTGIELMCSYLSCVYPPGGVLLII